MLHYTVSATRPHAHVFNVQLIIPAPNPQGQVISIPNWIPGSYLIRDFAKNIISIRATTSDNENLTLTKLDSNHWQCEKTLNGIIIEYEVYAFDPSIRGAYLNNNQAFINGSAIYLRAHGFEEKPCKVTLNVPNVPLSESWQVATTLPCDTSLQWGFGDYKADSYDELIDHPIQMGVFEKLAFEVKGIPHHMVVTGVHDGDLARLTFDVAKMCNAHIDLFHEAPFKEYLFLLTVRHEAYGGLEHRSSSALQIHRDALPLHNDPAVSNDYINLLGLFSHEYFHAWNVKQIKPQAFMPYDLDNKSYTTQLWAFEGFTSYYDNLALVRANVITRDQYYNLISESITKFLHNTGRKKQTLAESSWDAWIKFYQPNENSPNALVSYYLKGSLVALCIDCALRDITNNTVCLDDLMQHLWKTYGKPKIGVPENGIEQLLASLTDNQLSPLLHQLVYTTEEIPLEAYLEKVGLTLSLSQTSTVDKPNAFINGFWGCTINKNHAKVWISYVETNGAAERAGLSPLDEIIAINGLRVNPDSLEKITKRLAPGQSITVTIFKEDILKELIVTLDPPPFDVAKIKPKDPLSSNEKAILDNWLGVC